ncbi:ABC transporter ATP-binding protein [Desulfosarcina widdelii]|uniref:ABC transporter ATP-binding protein n=1 Tax=Desulfosarcina widdelii TaxID=947919 RepID=A0A5K7Z9E0_9BACT|nr:ABC transporter ATP-binding protein [Desulfosarcina widdelii]BBO75084.1 ABC transporter ATP-binding protein [Desulfosarcina widdelii]
MKPFLSVNEIHSGYDGVPVVHGVSLEVFRGEMVCIIGANGAGKTTTMRTICGLLHPEKGTVRFKDQDISRLPASRTIRRGISYVPEGRRLFPKLSVSENLSLGAFIEKDKREIVRREEEVLTLFPVLRQRANQKAETLSGGEQQMLAIARGMMSRPELLMLDEMSLGLMPSLVEKVMETIVQVNAEGTTVLLVEQMVQEALEISHRGYVLQTGRIVQSGSAKELMKSDEVRKAYMGM